MPAKAGQIVIEISAGTAKFVRDMESAKGTVREFGKEAHNTFSPTYAIKGLKDVAEGRYKFAFAELVDQMMRLRGSALVCGGIATGVAAVGIATVLVINHFKELAQLPDKIANEFRKINAPLQQTNDELRVTNDRLDDDIAKLEGKRQNTLKLALDEAIVSADKLAKSLDDDLERLNKILKQDNVSSWRKLLGEAGNEDLQKEFDIFTGRINAITDQGSAAIRAATDAKSKDAAQTALNTRLMSAYSAEIAKVNGMIGTASDIQGQRDNWHPSTEMRGVAADTSVVLAASRPDDQTQRIGDLRGALRQLKSELDSIGLQSDNASLAARKGQLSADSEARSKGLETTTRLTKELAAARAAQADSMARIRIEEDAEIAALKAAKQDTPANVATVHQIYDIKRLNEYTKLMEEYNKKIAEAKQQWTLFGIEAKGALSKVFGPEIDQGIKALDESAKSLAKWAEQYNQITAQSNTESLRHRVSMAGTNGNPNDPLGTLATQQAIERADIQDRYEEKLKLANTDLERSIALREKELELQKLQDEMEERTAELRHKSLRDFTVEMQGASKTAGDVLYDGAHEALDRVSDQFAKLITGQKTNFRGMFASIGEDMTKEATKSLMQKGLGALGKVFGIKPPAGKPDGTQSNPFYVILEGDKKLKNPLDGIVPSLPPALGGSSAASGLKGAIGGAAGWLGKIFGSIGSSGGGEDVTSSIKFMAGGGDADPGRVYGVAEAGEAELISPKNSSRITPISKLMGNGGASHTYNIDARGADLGAENRVARAIDVAHKSAVSGGVRGSSERTKRTPQRSRK